MARQAADAERNQLREDTFLHWLLHEKHRHDSAANQLTSALSSLETPPEDLWLRAIAHLRESHLDTQAKMLVAAWREYEAWRPNKKQR